MKKPTNTKNVSDASTPHSENMRQMGEREKEALELQEHAEHETGAERTRLQRAAKLKAK